MKKKHIEIYKSGRGWRWRLKAANGEIISQGESYSRRYGAIRGALRACGDITIVNA